MSMPAAATIDPTTGLPIEAPPAPAPFAATVPAPAPATQQSPTLPPGYVSEQEMLARVERARQEEKDKLYPRFEDLSTQVRTLAQEREERLANESAEQQRLAEEARVAREGEMDARSLAENYRSEMDQRFAALEAERALERAVHEKEIELAGLDSYKSRRIGEETDNIMPEFLPYIGGASQAEIEASIEKARQSSASIMGGVQELLGQQPPPRIPPIPVTGQPPIDSGAGNEPRELTLTDADIKNMSMEEYMQPGVREAILRAQSAHVRQNGYAG